MIRKIVLFLVPAILLATNLWGQTPQKYAVLIGGDINATNIPSASQWNNGQNMGPYGYDEFWNDTFLMWEMLYDDGKGYSNDNIYVLFNGGSDFSFQGQAYRYKSSGYGIPQITNNSSTKANVQSVFSSLANTLTDDDFLYVWIMSHGWNDTETQQGIHHSWVYLYGCDPANPSQGKLYDYELKTMLDAIPALKKVVFVQAPGSGGFADELKNSNTIVETSNLNF